MAVFASMILAFSMRLGCPTPIFLSRMNPSARYESLSDPPAFLMIWMWSKLPLPFNRSTASTARLAKYAFSWCTSLDERVVSAIFCRSSLNAASSAELSTAMPSSVARAISAAARKPSMMVMGWMRCWMRSSAARSSSPHSTATEVVPSPTSSSWMREISTRTLAAALSTWMERRIVAPSLVMVISPEAEVTEERILSMPLGPKVDFTKSATAMAPTKLDMRAFSPLSTCA
mmetsp:Transcript_48357/g.97296  ORF Transcript_48357/g.97296 Transcript_48357/m.97296 type:complete len:231 (+) Transcript_48357:1104-1796(+)